MLQILSPLFPLAVFLAAEVDRRKCVELFLKAKKFAVKKVFNGIGQGLQDWISFVQCTDKWKSPVYLI